MIRNTEAKKITIRVDRNTHAFLTRKPNVSLYMRDLIKQDIKENINEGYYQMFLESNPNDKEKELIKLERIIKERQAKTSELKDLLKELGEE